MTLWVARNGRDSQALSMTIWRSSFLGEVTSVQTWTRALGSSNKPVAGFPTPHPDPLLLAPGSLLDGPHSLGEVGVDKLVQLPLQDGHGIAALIARAVVLDQLVGVEDV